MALSNIALCSRALLKIGADTIASFDEGTTEAEVSVNLYGSVRDAMLSSYPWSFATAQVSLLRLAAAPVADFANAFQLPNDFLRVISAGTGGRGRGVSYRLEENRLHTNSEEVVLTYIFRPDENIFPPFFDQALIARLASEFCLPITESTSRSQLLVKQAADELKVAKSIDGQQDMAPVLENFSLVEVRR